MKPDQGARQQVRRSVDTVAGRQAHDDASGSAVSPLFSLPPLWPLLGAAAAGRAAAAFLDKITNAWAPACELAAPAQPLDWATPNTVALELSSMQLRDFSGGNDGQATLICAPYALHGASIADFAPGHSVVETLRREGNSRLFVTDWRSATPAMRYFSIDTYLADLNVAIDEIARPVDLIGLCQGGWLALLYAARFPDKVRRLVLVGAPVDIKAGESPMSRLVADLPISVFEALVRRGKGCVLGAQVLDAYGQFLRTDDAVRILQLAAETDDAQRESLTARLQRWNAATVDLPGLYYLQVVRWLFRQNRIAEGRFVALGHRVDLARIRAPIFLLAGRDDELVAPEQLFATARHVGTMKRCIETVLAPCGHLSLFMGRGTLGGAWRRIGHWLQSDLALAQAS